MTGSASRVAVCIGRKNATASLLGDHRLVEPLLREIETPHLDPVRLQRRRRRRQPEGLPAEVVGGDEEGPHGLIVPCRGFAIRLACDPSRARS